MKELKPILDYKQYHEIIFKKITDFWQSIFWDYIESVYDETLENSSNVLESALKSGKVHYEDGKFIGRFNARLSKSLEELGARFKGGVYSIPLNELDINTRQTIARVNILNQEKLKAIQSYVDLIPSEFVNAQLDFRPEVDKIGKNMDTQFKRSLSPINVIPMDLTTSQMQEIAKNYTNNLDKYVKKWTDEEVVKLREQVQQFVSKGYRSSEVKKWIEKEKGISERKAKFLSRQETTLLVGEYTKSRYKSAGIDLYKWSTIMDGRERPLHAKLNGKVFSWDSPPIIDERTGETGNPKEAYGCRCTAIPIIPDKWWESTQI